MLVKQTSGKFRPEIEGLRTIAFFLVAVFHIWLNRVSGGVDVFFTVAGLLVTLTLLSHVRRYGRVRPGMYFGRLLMRLLPAASVVLIAVLVLVVTLLPYAMWRDLFTQIIASATYWENWYLGFNAVDYLAIDTTRSPLQHFWALSIQGQFYVIWFLLFAAIAWGAHKAGKSVKRVAFVAVAALVAVSLAWSIYQTATNQQFAYFSTFTRVWEFGLGSLMAMMLDRIKLNGVVAAILSWIALASIILIGALLPVFDLFPGWIALIPVLAACVIVAAGQQEAKWGASSLLASKPMVWFGGLGYGVYLWHWPMLIFALEVQGRHRAGPLTGSAIIIGAIILAWLTKKFVEDPFMKARSSERPKARRFAIAIATTAVLAVAGSASAGVATVDRQTEAEQQEMQALLKDPCFGAGALSDEHECGQTSPEAYIPSAPTEDFSELYAPECSTGARSSTVKKCTWGDPNSAVRLALIGNSHSASWFPPYREIAERFGWRLDTYFRTACVYNATSRLGGNGIEPTCDQWTENLTEHLASEDPYDYVLTSAAGGNSAYRTSDGEKSFQAGVKGFARVWQPLIDRGATILAMRDYPASNERLMTCAIEDPSADCTRPRQNALTPYADEVLVVAAQQVQGAKLIDMSDWFCTETECPVIIGGVYVYRDASHFTKTYGLSLTDYLLQALQVQAGFPNL